MEIAVLQCNFFPCSTSWATPQLAPALSLGTHSLKMSLPSRSVKEWGMGHGEVFFWSASLLGPGEHRAKCSQICCGRAQPSQRWISLSCVPTCGLPQCHRGFALVPVPPASLAGCCGTPAVWAGCAVPHHAQPGACGCWNVWLSCPLTLCLACRPCPSLFSSAV